MSLLTTSLSLLLLISVSFADVVPKNIMVIDPFFEESAVAVSRLQPDDNVVTTNWLSSTFYEGSGCSGRVIKAHAMSTSFCYNNTGGGYYTYSCNSSEIHVWFS